VSEQDGQLVVRADVPGVNRDQIEVEIENGQLVVSGERKEEHEERRGGFYRTERSYGRFYRAIPLPDGVKPEQAQATFNNGVLEIRIPLPEQPQSQRIQVQEKSQSQTSQTRGANAA
jgi:HSP20 family protein